MGTPKNTIQRAKELRAGTWAAIASYGMWGLFPLYWKQIADINAIQILCHRMFWSALFLLAVVMARGLTGQIIPIFRQKQSLVSVTACGALISVNWGTYIWAVNSERVTEASLGYYITPLLSVALGGIFFKEKMDKWTAQAIIIATLGVALTTVMIGKPPWVAVSLAATFSVYGAIKKKADLDALAGLTAETLLAAPLALVWLLWAHSGGWSCFFGPDIKSATLLIVAGPVTAIPLLTFAYAAVRIPLQRIGFVQYFSPTIQLLIGLMAFGERLSLPMALAFATVIMAVAVYLGTRRLST
jgi:chloramphenicol-sensitive protein RarD